MTTAAVIGCGDVSVVHFEAIEAVPGGRLLAVCDADPVTAAATADRYGVPAFTEHARLLAALRPDVVHVCTPHHQHAGIVRDCLRAGINVIVEKPLAHTLAEAHGVVAEADRNPHVKIGVCFQNRYNATVQAAHRLLCSGELGRVRGAVATVAWRRTGDYYRARPWRGRVSESGGGVLTNQAIHALDLLQWLVGDVTRVSGHAGRYGLGAGTTAGTEAGIDVEDSAQLVLDHEDGARSVFFATVANATDSPVTLEIATEQAVLFIREDLTVTYGDGRVDVIPEHRASSGGRSYWGVSHRLLIADFYRKLADPEPFWISPREAVKAQRIIDQVYLMSRP